MGRPCLGQGRKSTRWHYDPETEMDIDENRWDPVTWFSQRGYNVTEMINAPGKYGFFESEIYLWWQRLTPLVQNSAATASALEFFGFFALGRYFSNPVMEAVAKAGKI